jgi:acetyl esterase/lipase
MITRRDLPYAPEHGRYGLLDVVLPDEPKGAPVVIVYHGGGLRALRKERMAHVAEFVARCGYVAVNTNYRLLPDAEFPAPIEDALRVVDWVQSADSTHLAGADVSQVAVLGASAGGYLVLMVGLLLGEARVSGIVSIAGPATHHCGVRHERLWRLRDGRALVPPVELVGDSTPPLLCVHSVNDELVRPSESRAIVERVRASGSRAELYEFDGPGKQHGIWRDESDPPFLFEHLEDRIGQFLSSATHSGRLVADRPRLRHLRPIRVPTDRAARPVITAKARMTTTSTAKTDAISPRTHVTGNSHHRRVRKRNTAWSDAFAHR